MFEISKYAKALPSILGLKERGKGLPGMSEQLVAVTDVRELYLLDTREFIALTNVAAAVTGVNAFPGAIVPAKELWYVWAFTAGAQPGAGAAISLTPAAFLDGAAGITVLGDYVSIAATENAQSRAFQPFWAGPGTVLAAYAKSQTLGPQILGNLVITRLLV